MPSMKDVLKQYKSLILSILILLDGVLDIVISIYYYKENETTFFILTLCIIFFTSIANSVNIAAWIASTDNAKLIAGFFISCLPLSVALPLIGLVITKNNYIHSKLTSLGFHFSDTPYFTVGIRFDATHQLSCSISIVWQSLPMSIVQMIYILNQSHNALNIIFIISLASSMLLVLSASLSFSKSLHPLNHYLFPRLCFATDLFLSYLTIYLLQSYPVLLDTLWIYKFIICIISLIIMYSIYVLCRIQFIYCKHYYIALKHDHAALSDYFYRMVVSWQPYYTNDNDVDWTNNEENTIKEWILFIILNISFFIATLVCGLIIIIIIFLMEFMCFTYIPLLLNHLIATHFVTGNDKDKEWKMLFQFIENSDNKQDQKLRFISCYQILIKSPFMTVNNDISMDKKRLFDHLNLEEQKILNFNESNPFQEVKNKELSSIHDNVMQKGWNGGCNLFEDFIKYGNGLSPFNHYVSLMMKYCSIVFGSCYILSRLIHITIPLIAIYYVYEEKNLFELSFIIIYVVLLLLLMKSGWKFINYHKIMWAFSFFVGLITNVDNSEGKRVGIYYTECITIQQRMIMTEECLGKNVANIVDQYVGRKLQ